MLNNNMHFKLDEICLRGYLPARSYLDNQWCNCLEIFASAQERDFRTK